jgi:phosphoribosylformylglycinamidine synthase
VLKPLVGAANDGPGDAAVLRPVLNSQRGLVIACGMNPRYGDHDPYHMAASAIDEAIRNCVAVGADPGRIAILDNFCWGYTDRPETLGSLVRAALACHDVALAFGTPFISGKDSLNNEFSYLGPDGRKQTISIPPSLLISALGQVEDVRTCVSMDLKQPGNALYLVGLTRAELGGSHLALVENLTGGQVPAVDTERALRTFRAVHQAIRRGLLRACHDLSEGGLAAALAEMAFAGGWGARVCLDRVPHAGLEEAAELRDATLLFAESNSRFLCEVPATAAAEFEAVMAGLPLARLGLVTDEPVVEIVRGDSADSRVLIRAEIAVLKEAWQKPLRW